MATTRLTPYLKLRVSSDLAADSVYNLERLDRVGIGAVTDATTSSLLLRSQADVYIEPDAAALGGDGTAGTIFLGTSGHEIERVDVYAEELRLSGILLLGDQASSGYLSVRYKSDTSGVADATSRVLSLDLQGANRNFILGGDITTAQAVSVLGGHPVSLTTSGSVSWVLPAANGPATSVLRQSSTPGTLEWSLVGGGTVTSVGLGLPAAEFSVSGSPVSSSGTLTAAWQPQVANSVLAGPTSGGAVAPSFRQLSSSDLTEGVNLFYTDERVDDRVSSLIQNGTGISWGYNDTLGTLTPTVSLSPFSTTNLAEGTNLYFTDERVDDRVSSLIQPGTGISWSYSDGAGTLTPTVSLSPFSTTNLSEGTNLYYTDTRVDSRISSTWRGAANGVASLVSGKVPVSQLPSSVFLYQGVWNASTNTPTLADGTGTSGFVYRVSVAGTQNLGSGAVTYDVGDLVLHDGTVWQRSDSTDAVTTVNGLAGTVVLDTDDVSEGTTNLYFTDERVDDRVAVLIQNGTGISWSYSDGAGTLTPTVSLSPFSTTNLAEGTNLYFTSGRAVTEITAREYTTTWVTGDGTTKVVTHSLSSTDVSVSIFDIDSGEDILVDSVDRTSSSVVTLTSTEAPSGSGWRVLVREYD